MTIEMDARGGKVREARFLRLNVIPVLVGGGLALAGCSSSSSSSSSSSQIAGLSSSSSSSSSSGADISALSNAVNQAGTQSYIEQIFYGAALVAAITVPKATRERFSKRRRAA
jgi:hypothetical protein